LRAHHRIEVIDLLRGLSCLGVLFYHVRIDLWIGWWRITRYPQEYSSFAKAMAWLSIPTPFLGYAILLFFLISGFCIHYPNTLSDTKPCWKIYFKRRFWRIYPTYLIAILFTSVISYFCHMKWGDIDWNFERIFRVATVSQNYPPGNGQFLTNPSLWTIPLEIEFYALYPLAFFCILKFGFFTLLILSVGFSVLGIYLTRLGLQWVSYTSLLLWPSWLLGAWIASLHRENKLSKLKIVPVSSMLILFLVIALASRLKNWEGWTQYASWTGFYFTLFLVFLRFEKSITGLRENLFFKSLAWLGQISFSLYLIHFPLFKLFGFIHLYYFQEKPANFIISLAYMIPVFFLAWIFYRLIEHPIHKWSKRLIK
jgi:peptidoglycan/LPS O-acetylase OafA/YrhL